MALLAVDEALAKVVGDARPRQPESVPLALAHGRVLARDITSQRSQPPFDASAMDGYAVRLADILQTPATLRLIGTSAAGAGFDGALGSGEAVRIFTGAPVPQGADTVIIQENVSRPSDGQVEILQAAPLGKNIRREGLDFKAADTLLEAGRVLNASALSLAASGNHAALCVWKKPVVALIATGDELVLPGATPKPDQIIASNSFGVAAIVAQSGGEAIDLGIAPDRREAIGQMIENALAMNADVIVTLGGASVGDHDLAHAALADKGLDLAFWKIAMRPGKPLMFGTIGSTRCIGLPGNPVSSLICSHLFLKPLVRALAGLPPADDEFDAVLSADMPANDLRQDYVRASVVRHGGILHAAPVAVQDSAMLRTLANSNAVIIRPPHANAAKQGDPCRVLMLR